MWNPCFGRDFDDNVIYERQISTCIEVHHLLCAVCFCGLELLYV